MKTMQGKMGNLGVKVAVRKARKATNAVRTVKVGTTAGFKKPSTRGSGSSRKLVKRGLD